MTWRAAAGSRSPSSTSCGGTRSRVGTSCGRAATGRRGLRRRAVAARRCSPPAPRRERRPTAKALEWANWPAYIDIDETITPDPTKYPSHQHLHRADRHRGRLQRRHPGQRRLPRHRSSRTCAAGNSDRLGRHLPRRLGGRADGATSATSRSSTTPSSRTGPPTAPTRPRGSGSTPTTSTACGGRAGSPGSATTRT